jgi:hypothetical protein
MKMNMQIQGPTDEATSIPLPMENGALRRKVAMRTSPWLLRAAELDTVSPLPGTLTPVIGAPLAPQDEDLLIPPVAKRPRLETSEDLPPVAKRPRLETSTDAVVDDDAKTVDTNVPSGTVAVAVTPLATPISDDDTPATPPAASSPKAAKVKTARVTLWKWTPDEDAKLTNAVKIFGSAWIRVAEMIDGRTNNQCRKRWVDNLDPSVSCNSGKWTRGEDAFLAVAVKQFGNEWSAVATLVPGRTNIQCRQRWARGLDPENGGDGSGELKARKWTPAEDAKLADAAEKFGNEWTAVAALVPGRTNAQCRQRWVNRLNPANGAKCRKWIPSEDAMLARAVRESGNDWTAVAAKIDGRTNIQCRQRWLHSLDHAVGVKTGKWTQTEDHKLLKGAKKFGNDWDAVAATVHGRTNGQCCQRWLETVRDSSEVVKCKTWTLLEDACLGEAMERFGKDWNAVATLVPNRTNVQCGKRWAEAFHADNSDKGEWTPEEDANLTEAVKKCGEHDWSAVAALIPRRGEVQCRQRWFNILHLAKEKWTTEEDIMLIEAVGECGEDWTAVAALVPKKTNAQCSKRWTRAFDTATGDEDKGDQVLWWTPEEDAELTEGVKRFGNNWSKVAPFVNNDRTNDECRHRWVRHLDPDRCRSYAVEEDQEHYDKVSMTISFPQMQDRCRVVYR